MIDFKKASVGIYGDFFEYRRMNYRRLFLQKDFNLKESLEIGRKLEKVSDFNIYINVKIKKGKYYVHIGSKGCVALPISNNRKKIKTNRLEDLSELPEETDF